MTDPADAARSAATALSAVAEALYEVENGADMVFVRSQAELGGTSGSAAAAIVDELARLWVDYPVGAAAVEALDKAVAARNDTEATRLLGPDGVTLPGGSPTALTAVLADLRRRAAKVADDAAGLAGAARQAIGRLDRAGVALTDLAARAALLDATDEPELVAAQQAYATAAAALATDPAAPAPVAAVEAAVQRAATRVEHLEHERLDLPAALDRADAQLAEIRRLVDQGHVALVRARAKMAAPEALGLLEALDPAGLDGDERALGPWLDRIHSQAGTGGWQAAATGLGRWRQVADAWLANARRVAEANAAPLRRRNELRGLLDAYRAKAVARGGVEDEHLAALHEAARTSLYNAPCDLPEAEAAVRRYVDAVNAGSRTRR